jgi:hypothetical protein
MEKTDHRTIAVAQYNNCWELLEKEKRTSDDDVELMTSAFVSRYHWSMIGTHDQFVMADWMVSRTAAATKNGDLSIQFALLAFERAQASETPDWLKASVAEGLARAYACAGRVKERNSWFAEAERLVQDIIDPDDRELISSQLRSVPGYECECDSVANL